MNKINNKVPIDFYQKIVEAENKFQLEQTKERCEQLLILYKEGIEYFDDINSKEYNYFINGIQRIVIKQIATKILSDDNSKKKIWNFNNQSLIYNKLYHDYNLDIKNIISKYNNSIKKSLNIFKEIINIQNNNFRKNIEQKIYKSRFEKNEYERDKLIFDNQKSKQLIKYNKNNNFIRTKQRYNSTRGINFSKNNFIFLSGSSFFKKKKSQNPNQRNVCFNEIHLFQPKQDLPNELIIFLKNYSKKLYYLFQTPLNDTLNKLNNIIEKAYSQLKFQYLEYEENLKGYLSLTEDPTIEPFKSLIEALKEELNESIFLINRDENKEIEILINEMKNNKLNESIIISNLNDDTIAQIAEIFK